MANKGNRFTISDVPIEFKAILGSAEAIGIDKRSLNSSLTEAIQQVLVNSVGDNMEKALIIRNAELDKSIAGLNSEKEAINKKLEELRSVKKKK